MTSNSPLHSCLIKIRSHYSLNHDSSHWKSAGKEQTELSQQAKKPKKRNYLKKKKGDFFSLQKGKFSSKFFNKENKTKAILMWKWTLTDILLTFLSRVK